MSDLIPEAKAKRRIDTFIYGAAALVVVGIDVKPWFQSQSEISIAKAKADAEVYVINAKTAAERARRTLPKQTEHRLKLLEKQVRELTINSHKPVHK